MRARNVGSLPYPTCHVKPLAFPMCIYLHIPVSVMSSVSYFPCGYPTCVSVVVLLCVACCVLRVACRCVLRDVTWFCGCFVVTELCV
eukprot:1318401-Amorphochlora_amoeboformis.AAC.1